MKLEFREIADEDFPLLTRWLREPHVRRWWNDGDVSIKSVERDYGPEDGLVRYILRFCGEDQVGSVPIGFFQHYEWVDGSIGIDLLIGEARYINRGVGTRAVGLFAELIFERFVPEFIFADPHPENTAAVKCCQNAGFVKYGTGFSSEGEPAVIMRMYKDERD